MLKSDVDLALLFSIQTFRLRPNCHARAGSGSADPVPQPYLNLFLNTRGFAPYAKMQHEQSDDL